MSNKYQTEDKTLSPSLNADQKHDLSCSFLFLNQRQETHCYLVLGHQIMPLYGNLSQEILPDCLLYECDML